MRASNHLQPPPTTSNLLQPPPTTSNHLNNRVAAVKVEVVNVDHWRKEERKNVMVVVAMRMVVVAEKVVEEKAVEMKEITSFLRLSHFANHR